MRRAGGLWPGLVSYDGLLAAAKAAAAGKRTRPDVARFLLDLEPEVLTLRRELLDGSYRPGPYRTFEVREPKPRLISAAPFRDRVVHHALTRALEPVFEPRFSPFSFACRKGLGSHRALTLARAACARFPFVLKADVVRYFSSVDHELLKGLLARFVKCRRTLALAGLVVDASDPPADSPAYFPGDNLFTPFERRRGLPLGNQTSQFFANVYLDPLDQHVVRTLRPGAYARYVDDVLVFGRSRAGLEELRREVERFLAGLRLRIHPRKGGVFPTAGGVTFLGWRLFPDRARLVRGNVVRFRRRLKEMQEGYASGKTTWWGVRQRIAAWQGHAAFGDTWRLRESILDAAPFQRRCAAV